MCVYMRKKKKLRASDGINHGIDDNTAKKASDVMSDDGGNVVIAAAYSKKLEQNLTRAYYTEKTKSGKLIRWKNKRIQRNINDNVTDLSNNSPQAGALHNARQHALCQRRTFDARWNFAFSSRWE